MPKVPKTTSLEYLKKNVKDEVDFLPADKRSNISSNWDYHFRCVWPSMPKLPKITSLPFLCNILRKKRVMKLNFGMQINMKSCYKLMQRFWGGWSSILKVPKIAIFQCLFDILKKKLEMKLIFCIQINVKVSTTWHHF